MNNLRFADDIDIIEQRNEKLQDTVNKLHTESERYRMLGRRNRRVCGGGDNVTPTFWTSGVQGVQGGRSNENDLCFYSSLYSVLYK